MGSIDRKSNRNAAFTTCPSQRDCRAMKWVFRILVVLVAVVGALLWFFWSQLDQIIKYGIEKGAPPVVQTSVTVEKVRLSPFSGTGLIEGFVIGNPKGFSGPYAVRVGKAEIALDTQSVSGDKLVIKFIRISDPEINLEAGPSGTNLKHIAENAKSFAAKESAALTGGGVGASYSGSQKQKKEMKLQVNELVITGAKVKASAAGLLPGAEASAKLTDIHLTNLGVGEGGISPADLTAQVLNRLSTETTKASVGGAVKGLLEGKLESGALKEGLKGLLGK